MVRRVRRLPARLQPVAIERQIELWATDYLGRLRAFARRTPFAMADLPAAWRGLRFLAAPSAVSIEQAGRALARAALANEVRHEPD